MGLDFEKEVATCWVTGMTTQEALKYLLARYIVTLSLIEDWYEYFEARLACTS